MVEDIEEIRAAPDDGQVDPDRFQAVLLVLVESPAQPNQQDHGRNTPNDPKHSEKAAHLVRKDGVERLSEELAYVHQGGRARKGVLVVLRREYLAKVTRLHGDCKECRDIPIE